jgi:molybdopterin synthase sulfur carrier subunit
MVTIRFFAQLRDVVGTDSLQFAADDLEQVYAHLRRTLGSETYTQLRAENVRVAVNQDIVSANHRLLGGDEVAFLPPVTGG